MQAFKLYLKILNKKKGILLTYLVFFTTIWVALTSVNSKDINKYNNTFKNTSIAVAYIDEDNSKLSHTFTTFLADNTTVKSIEHNPEALKDALFMDEVNFVVTIPKGFEANFTRNPLAYQLKTQQKANASEGFLAQQMIDDYLNKVYTFKVSNPSMSYKQIDKQVRAINTSQIKVSMASKDSTKDEQLIVMFYNTLGYVIISIMILIGTGILNSVYRSDVHIRTLASPISNVSFNSQLFLGNICFGVTVWFLFTALSIILNPTLLSKAGALYSLNAFIMTMTALSFAFLCANLLRGVKNSLEAINGIANVFALGSSFICGNFVPQSILSQQVLDIASFFPNYWYVKINDFLPNFDFASSQHWQTILQAYGIQILFILAFFLAGQVISKVKQQVRNIN